MTCLHFIGKFGGLRHNRRIEQRLRKLEKLLVKAVVRPRSQSVVGAFCSPGLGDIEISPFEKSLPQDLHCS